ncbi:MAG: sulfotransferase, partial [Methylococcales bacterium]
WKLLTDLAKSAEDTKLFLEFHSDVYEHGLLEWRLSVESWLGFSHSLPEQSFYEITYDELVAKPVDVIRRCLQFLNLETNPIVDKFARNTIRRQSMRSTTNPLTDRESLVAGDLLRSVRKLYLSSEAK